MAYVLRKIVFGNGRDLTVQIGDRYESDSDDVDESATVPKPPEYNVCGLFSPISSFIRVNGLPFPYFRHLSKLLGRLHYRVHG